MVKPLFNNAESKEKINHLIEMVNHFSNKSNSYITTHLNDF